MKKQIFMHLKTELYKHTGQLKEKKLYIYSDTCLFFHLQITTGILANFSLFLHKEMYSEPENLCLAPYASPLKFASFHH